MDDIDWKTLYVGGVISSFLLIGVIVVWTDKKNHVAAFGYVGSILWPLIFPLAIFAAFTSMNKTKEPANDE